MAGVKSPPRLWTAFVVAGVGSVALCLAVATGGPILEARWRLLVLLGVWTLAWGVAVAVAFRLPGRAALAAVLVAGVAVRLAALAGPPTLSDDLYRYAWDGRVQASGGNPYQWMPQARAVAGLREAWLWPDAQGCRDLRRPPGCTRINRPAVRTIYPPLAQAWFATVYRLGGVEARHQAWQLAGFGTELALLALLPLALRAWGRDPRWTALYALSPFPVVEVVNNGHVDGLAALLVVAGVALAARTSPWRWAAAGAVIGAAAMVKLYPAVALVGLVAAGRRRPRLVATGLAGAAAVAVGAYLPHVVSVGSRVLGYLPGYLREERYASGERHLLTGALGVPGEVAAALAAAAVVAVVAVTVVRRVPVPAAATLALGSVLLALTPVQPWYAVVLLGLAAVAGAPAWAAVVAAGYPYFFAVILDSPRSGLIGRIGYGLALVAVLAAARSRRTNQRPPSLQRADSASPARSARAATPSTPTSAHGNQGPTSGPDSTRT